MLQKYRHKYLGNDIEAIQLTQNNIYKLIPLLHKCSFTQDIVLCNKHYSDVSTRFGILTTQPSAVLLVYCEGYFVPFKYTDWLCIDTKSVQVINSTYFADNYVKKPNKFLQFIRRIYE